MKRRMVMAGGVLGLAGCATGQTEYEQAVQSTWRHSSGELALMQELVRYATLAPSSHNTQCWKFRAGAQKIAIRPDFTRRCPAVDPDDHHLFVSLGCATENLIQAALARGYHGETITASDGVEITLEPTKAIETESFAAIPRRQSTRAEFDGKPLGNAELRRLEMAGTSPDVQVLLLTDRQKMDTVLECVVNGNTAQMGNPAFLAELKAWLRFSDAEALRTRDGLFTRASGNPVAPRWLAGAMFDQFFTAKSENDKYARHVRSSAGIAIFVSTASSPANWVSAGRAFERFALQATALGIRTAHLNQPVEVATLRPEFGRALGITQGRPDLVVRFGRGPELPRSLRRPIQEVLS
ncbi:MAG: hypothetical protein K2X03_09025 [Bryobacteraceae bacterium]|nr:hypothetical protein [Bryobacteraceae bacterium]